MRLLKVSIVVLILIAVAAAGCNRRRPQVVPPPPSAGSAGAPPSVTTAPPPPTRVDDALPVPPQPVLPEDDIASRSLDDLNRNSPLQPVFFELDSAELTEQARATAQDNAEVLRKYPSWVVTIEGHCDERGTAEYNLALGERRASAVKTYLVSLGVSADRIRTVSYGNEFPFDPAETEEAYAKNRRGHFVITER